MRRTFGFIAVITVTMVLFSIVFTRIGTRFSPLSWFSGASPNELPEINPEMDQVLIEDNFDENQGWDEAETKVLKRYIADGAYHHENTSENDFYVSTKSADLTNDDDFSLEATFQKTKGQNVDSYGLVWGYGGEDGYYIFGVTGNGRFGVYRKEQEWEAISEFMDSAFVHKGNTTNVLRIERKGSDLRFFVNNTFVHITSPVPFFGKKVGMYVDSGMNVSVEHFSLRKK